jgi:CDP-diacylglycerol---serine O-phosphatidyltransferase
MLRQLRYLVPNGFTAASMFFGLASVTRSAAGDYELAAWMILWCVLLDNVDGASARLLGAGSKFGQQMDSFADLIAFGVAPAALVFFRLQSEPFWTSYAWLLGLACGVHVLADAARLSRFNVVTSPRGADFYQGLTTTIVGAMLASYYLICANGSVPAEWLTPLPIVMLGLSALMVSNLPFPKLRRRRSRWVNVVQVVNALVIYIVGPLRLFPEYIFSLTIIYPVVGITWAMLARSDEPSEELAEA